jgi:V8-like Glu-specific endopeptidase
MEIASRTLALARATEERFHCRKAPREKAKKEAAAGNLWKVDSPDRIRKRLDRLAATEPSTAPGPQINDLIANLARERAIGTVDLVARRYLDLALAAARCVGRITVRTISGKLLGYGTGWLVAPGIVLTNNHVLESAGDASASEIAFGYDSQELLGEVRTATLVPERLFVTDKDLDFTFVAVNERDTKQRALADLGWLSLNGEEGKVINHEFVTLIQHPSGGPKMFALRENRIVDVLDNYLHYEADTAPGSSGSPVLNDQFEIVALHHSGVPDRDSSGQVLNLDGGPWTTEDGEGKVKWIANEGIRVSRLVAKAKSIALGTKGETLLNAAWDQRNSTPRVVAMHEAVTPQPLSTNTNTNGSGIWTIPLQISVSFGGEPAAVAAAAVQTSTAATSAPSDHVVGNTAGSQSQFASPELVRAVAAARDAFRSVPGVLEIRAGWRFRGGWITDEPAIVAVVTDKLRPSELARKDLPLLPDKLYGFPIEVRQASAEEVAEIEHPDRASAIQLTERETNPTYVPPPGIKLPRVKERMQVRLHVGPECSWPNLKGFLEGTTEHLTVGMYDFGAVHIRDTLLQTLTARRTLRLLIQYGQSLGGGTKADDWTDAEMMEALKKALGRRFSGRWVSVAQTDALFASAYHIKVAVRDHLAFWLSSGNWQSSNQPPNVPQFDDAAGMKALLQNYNREWHVLVQNATLAKTFEQYIEYDYERSEGFTPRGATEMELYELQEVQPVLEEAGQLPEIKAFEPLDIDRELDIQTVLSPDNYVEVVRTHLESATHSIYFQNQYINESRDERALDNYVALVKLIGQKQRAGLDVRIILRKDSGVEARHLEFLKNNGVDINGIRWRNRTHTKGIIVDGEHVLVGSHNWSFDGLRLNRDASLLFYDKEVAQYFQQVFLYDWENWTTSRAPIRQSKPRIEELSPSDVRELGRKGIAAHRLFRETG